MSAAQCYAAGHPPLSISISHPLGQQQQSLPLWHSVLSPFVWPTEFCTRSQSRSSTGCQGHVFARREYRDCVSNASLYQITYQLLVQFVVFCQQIIQEAQLSPRDRAMRRVS